MALCVFRCSTCGALNGVPKQRQAAGARCGHCQREMLVDGTPQEVDLAAFETTVEHAPVPVLVDFGADWCHPCRLSRPIVDSVARERAGAWLVLRIDTDLVREVAGKYQVRGVPTLAVYVRGQERARHDGLLSKRELDVWLERVTAPLP